MKEKNYINLINIMAISLCAVLITKQYASRVLLPFEFYRSVISIGNILMLALVAAKLVYSKTTKEDVILLSVTVILYLITRDKTMALLIAIAIFFKDIENEKVVKLYLYIGIICFASVIILNLMGLIPIEELYWRIVDGKRVERYTLGFGNPNTPYFYGLGIIGAYIYLRYDNYNIYDRLIIIIPTIIIYSITDSRTGFIAIVLALILVEVSMKIDFSNIKSAQCRIFAFLPILLAITSIIIGVFFRASTFMNKLLSSRPRMWGDYIEMSTLLGTNDKIFNQPLDNSYLYILFIGGSITLILFLVTLYIAIRKSLEENNVKLVVVFTMFAIYSFGENLLTMLGVNFAIILLLKDINIYDYKNLLKSFKVLKINNKYRISKN